MPHRLVDPHRSPRLRAVLHVIAGVATGVFIVGAAFLTITTFKLVEAVRETQVSNVQRAEADRHRDERTDATAADAARAAARIEDCTTPGRKCFEDGQKRLGRTVGTINRYAIAAAYCADQTGEQSVPVLERCIAAVTEQPRHPRGDRP